VTGAKRKQARASRLPGAIPMTKNRTFVLLAVALLVLSALVFRLPSLQERPVDIDEVYSYLAAKGTVEYGVPQLPAGHNYTRGILATYFNAGAILILGDSVQSLRFVSLLFSLLAIVSGFLIGSRMFDRTTGLLPRPFSPCSVMAIPELLLYLLVTKPFSYFPSACQTCSC
jgi:predicted membrane-bound mannosyltransferase